MQPKVTILMPVFNGERYLRTAIDSVISQTLEDIEIMICNNGSTDRTLEIAEEYQNRDSRIVIRTHPNIGQGPNLVDGLKFARGKYIGEVDADDKVDPTMFQKLYDRAERYGADVVKCHYSEFGVFWRRDVEVFPPIFEDIHLSIGLLPDNLKSVLICRPPCIFCGLYNREFLLKNGLFFRPDKNYEDTSLMFKIATSANCFVYYDEPLYWHRADNPNSGTNTLKDLEAISEQYDEIRRFNAEKFLTLEPWINTMMFYTYRWMFNRCRTDEEKLEFYKIMHRDFKLHPAPKNLFNSNYDFQLYESIRR